MKPNGRRPRLLLLVVLSSACLPVAFCGLLRQFSESFLPSSQTSGEFIEGLGNVIRLDTLLRPRRFKSISTKFSIFNREQMSQLRMPQVISYQPAGLFNSNTSNEYQFDLDAIAGSGFNPRRRTVVLISGYLTGDRVGWMERARDLWLQLEDVDVILITWRDANRYLYSTAVADTPLVARQVTIFFFYLAELHGLDWRDESFLRGIHFVGHSLGAHIAGFVGQDLGGRLGRISGLDPAGPSFDLMPRQHRLDKGDAIFVDIIHSNSGQMRYTNAAASSVVLLVDVLLNQVPLMNRISRGLSESYSGEGDTAWFGIDAQLGHVDYYANNGRVQPGCAGLMHICDHGRAYEIYEDILLHELQLRKLGLSDQLLEQSRLLAFVSGDFHDFSTGNNLNFHCPALLDEHSADEAYQALKRCSIPMDFTSPVDKVKAALQNGRMVNLNDPHYHSARQFYFKTNFQRRFVGDHYLLKVRLDKASTWDAQCAFKVELTMAGGPAIFIEANKELRLVSTQTDGFFGIAMPFVNPVGVEARAALTEVLSARNQSALERVLSESIDKMAPREVRLSVSSAHSVGVIELLRNKLTSLISLNDNEALNRCQLEVVSVEVQPLVGLERTFTCRYGSGSGAPVRLETAHSRKSGDSERRFKLSPLKEASLLRSLEAVLVE